MGPRKNELVIDDGNADKHIDVVVDGERKGKGLIPRDYDLFPVGYLGDLCPPMHAVDMPLIPRSEWSARIKEMEETKSRLSDIRLVGNNGQAIPALDQNGFSLCWAHSTTMAVMMTRAAANEPYVPLSAFAVACMITNFVDQGGWGAQSLEFISSKGVPAQSFWPQQSMARSNNTPACWENAAQHKVTEGWIDLQAAKYNRKLTFDQVITCLLCRIPVVGDYSWWQHSVVVLDAVEVSPGSFGVRILNSWGNSFGDRGMAVLEGNKAIPDGATAPRVSSASVV